MSYFDSIELSIRPWKVAGDFKYECRLEIRSHYLGLVVVSDVGETIHSAVKLASLRARAALRRRRDKRRSKRRTPHRNRISRLQPNVALN